MYVTPDSSIFRRTAAICSSRPPAETKRSRSVATGCSSSFRRPWARGTDTSRARTECADSNGGIAHRSGQETVAPPLPVFGCAVCTYTTPLSGGTMTISHREPVAAALARVPGRLMVAVPHTDHSEPVERGRADELAVLYEIIHTVTSTLDVEAVLAAIVRLVNDAIVAHATYIFLAEDGGRRIVLRA